ncbi:MAG: TetR/AcrR family transcriptional regulator [Gammaproteobacteria bacterium]|jgi:AcrR family transcriptional regulator
MSTTARKRLSREESRELTRQRLLEAAARVIPEKGFQAASVEDIAEAAGFSRGAFYSNFRNKDELLIALLQSVKDEKHEALRRIFAEGSNNEELADKVRDFYAGICSGDDRFMLWTEAKMHAVRCEEFREMMRDLERQQLEQITAFVRQYCDQMNGECPARHAEIARGLMALTDGMAFAKLLDPERVGEQDMESVLSLFFEQVVRPRD